MLVENEFHYYFLFFKKLKWHSVVHVTNAINDLNVYHLFVINQSHYTLFYLI